MVSYPDEFFRGIPSESFCFENNLARPTLFCNFDNVNREDGFNELSITWNDNDESVKIISNQKKSSGELQFKFGLAVLQRSILDIAKHNPHFRGILNYERKASHDNPYHGNILLKANEDKQKRNMVASFLAMNSKIVLRDSNTGEIELSSCDVGLLFNENKNLQV